MYLRNAVVAGLGSLVLSVALGASDVAVTVVNAAAALDPCEPEPPSGKGGEARPAVPKGLRIIPGYDFDSFGPDMSGPFSDPDAYEAVAAEDSHAYFSALSRRSDCLAAYSLRSMDQLLAYMDHHKWFDVTYGPATDADPRRQDAAKIVIPANVVSLPNNVRVPIPPVGSSSLLVTWESWLGAEYAFANTGIGNYKHFQFASSDRIWTEVKADFNKAAPPAVAMVEVRQYGESWGGVIGPNVTNDHPLSPMNAQFPIMPETWTRYWAYFNPVGDWHEFSLWLADTNRDPVLVLDRLQIRPNVAGGAPGWEKFWLESNTSAKGLPAGFGARVAYARNIVMLRGVSDVKSLLQRPVK